MAQYLQAPGVAKGKAQYFVDGLDAIVIDEPTMADALDEEYTLVCILDNGPFEAAMIVDGYEWDRLQQSFAGGDNRPRTWVLIESEQVKKYGIIQ